MGDIKCYYLLSADAKCMEGKLNIENLDLTSIVNALDNKEDPAKILCKADRNDLVQHTMNYFLESIDSMMLWFDQTFLPTMHVMEKPDIKICVKKLGQMQEKIYDLMLIKENYKTTKSRRRHWQTNTKFYSCLCKQCNTDITISNSNCDALDLFENHEHIAAVISGNIPCEEYDLFDSKQTQFDKTNLEEISETKIEISTSPSSSSISESDASSSKSNQIISLSSDFNHLSLEEVNKVLYPQYLKKQMKLHETHCNFKHCTVQCFGTNMYHCLLCDSIMQEQSLLQHFPGQRHQFNLKDPFCLKKVKNYHEIMNRLPAACQIHQVTFTTDKKIPLIKCKVCVESIKESAILDHVRSRRHRTRLRAGRHTKYHFSNEIQNMIALDDAYLIEVPVQSLVVYNSNIVPEIKDTISTNVSVQSDYMKNCNDLNNVPLSGLVTQEKTLSDTNSTPILKSTALLSAITNHNSGAAPKNGETSSKTVDSKKSEAASNNKKETPKVIQHDIVPSFKSTPDDFFDLIENRFQFQRQYLQQLEDHIFCTLCSVKMPVLSLDIRKHIKGKLHEKHILGKRKEKHGVSNDELRYVFFCDLCSKYCYEEHTWAEHFSGLEHKQRIDSIGKIIPKISPFLEYECKTCRLILYGNQNSVKFHRIETVSKRNRFKAKEIKLPPHLDNLMINDGTFYEKVYKMLHESEAVLRSIELSYNCCGAIQNALKSVFGECKAYPFGSRVSGLGNIESDLDVFVDLGFMFDGLFYQDSTSQSNFVNEATKVLRRHVDFCNIIPIPHARTPIIQVYHRGTRMDCDLSFRNGLSVKNTEFLRLSISVQPILKSLILFLKHWSLSCKFNMRISTYALSMLSIFFMQTQGYLPSLKKIRELDPTASKIIGGWHTYSYNRSIEELQTHVKKCTLLIKDVVREFFLYYSTFKYNLEVVCPLMGEPVLKKYFSEDNGKNLPPEMQQYIEKINLSAENERFRALSAMCVQDPFDLSHNLTKSCPSEAVNRFISLSILSAASLSKNP